MELSQQLKDTSNSLFRFLPEAGIIATIIGIIILDLILLNKSKKVIETLTYFGLGAVILLNSLQGEIATELSFFSGMLHLNETIIQIKYLLDFATIGCLLIYTLKVSHPSNQTKNKQIGFGEERIFWLSLLLGAHGMLMANHWISLYLSIELASISAYTLAIFRFEKKSAEASIKYLIIGAFSSALMLYGISWIYGFTGSLAFSVSAAPNEPLLVVGFLLSVSAVLFKIAAVPFQIWVPAVYQSAPVPVTAFFSIVPKLAGVYLLYHVANSFGFILPTNSSKILIGIVGIVSVGWGNFSALKQQNITRMMGYSSIAQAGLLLVALSVTAVDFKILLFYFKIYILMNLTAFVLIDWLSNSSELSSFSGLGKRTPLIGIIAVICMISLTGLPPTAGFIGKFLIFSSLWEMYQHSNHQALLWIFVVGVLNTVVSLFYYLKLPYFMFLKEAPAKGVHQLTFLQNLFLVGLGIGLILLFVFPY